MPFCYSPWTNLDINPQGTLSPCCKFQLTHYKEKYNVQTDTVVEYINSDFLKQIRDEFQQDQWPVGCQRCKIEEQNNIASKRQLDYQRWEEHYSKVNLESSKFLTASVAFGNTCNLKCITCNSVSSSKWHREYLEVYNTDFRPVHFYRKDFVSGFVSQVPDLLHLDIPGGEPLLSGVNEQKQLLQHYVDIGKSKEISIHYTTNASIFPDNSWINLWKHFREVEIQLSIDGIGARYEYIRYPANWEELQKNARLYIELEKVQNNIRLSVSHTVSAYNILYIPEFLTWCQTTGLPEPWLGRVHNPVHMRPEVWPATVRQFIQQTLTQDSNNISQTWAKLLDQDNSDHFNNFIKYTHIHDRNRGLNFSLVFSELAQFI